MVVRTERMWFVPRAVESTRGAMEAKDWKSTATLLRGALDRVERHITRSQEEQSTSSSDPQGAQSTSSSARSSEGDLRSSTSTPRGEFNRLFGYRPDVSQHVRETNKPKAKKRKGMGRATPCQTRARAGYTWKKETVCLRFKDQTKGPDCTEKMELARIGLGLKELSFDSDGDAIYIHSVLLTAFKQLDACGGYTLLRLATNSTDLIEIQPPKGGMTVRYLKDIVKSAKLFVRPLQTNIDCDEDSQPEVISYAQSGKRACKM